MRTLDSEPPLKASVATKLETAEGTPALNRDKLDPEAIILSVAWWVRPQCSSETETFQGVSLIQLSSFSLHIRENRSRSRFRYR